MDKKSNIAVGIIEKQLLLTSGSASSVSYNLPDDFFTNEINYVAIKYNQNVKQNSLYINGQKIKNASKVDAWVVNNSLSDTAFGRRLDNSLDTYFKGILYNFNIYDGLLDEEEIINIYQDSKQKYEQN